MPYIGRDLRTGAFRQLDDISSGFDGSDTTHTMQVNSTNVSVGDVNQILLSLGGVIQKPGTDFTVSGSTLTFTTAPAANTSFFAILLGSDNGGTVTPTDLSVTTAKIAADNVTPPKTNFFNTDPGNAADLGMLHIKSGDSSASVSVHADELVLEGSANAGLSVLSGTSNTGSIFFGDSGDNDIGYIQYEHGSTDGLYFGTNGGTRMIIDSTGAVTKPNQPAFLVKPTNVQSDFNQGQTITIVLDNEIFDNNADFDTSNYTFTAPVTGRYCFQFAIQINQVSNQDSALYYYIELNTSNRPFYNLSAIQEAVGSSAGQLYFTLPASVTCDMDANDTATLRVVMGGTSGTGPSDISNNSHFSGFLVC